MPNVRIYNDETDSYATVSFDLKQTLLQNGSTGDIEYYIDVYTSLKKPDGTGLGRWTVRNLGDVPPGSSTATNFTELCQMYIAYFAAQSEMAQSSESSSSSSSSSSQSSSSSSSFGRSSSSSSSSNSSSSSSSSSSVDSSSSSSSPIDG